MPTEGEEAPVLSEAVSELAGLFGPKKRKERREDAPATLTAIHQPAALPPSEPLIQHPSIPSSERPNSARPGPKPRRPWIKKTVILEKSIYDFAKEAAKTHVHPGQDPEARAFSYFVEHCITLERDRRARGQS